MQTWVTTAIRGTAAVLLVSLVALSGCTRSDRSSEPPTAIRTSSSAVVGTHPLPQELKVVPGGFSAPAERQGTLVELMYDTYESMSYEQKTQKLTKRAIVYLPYGYTSDVRYNVFYLMHGGWGNETSTFGTPASPNGFKNVIDNAVAAGEIKPLIIVCPSYNNTSPQDSASFSLALTLNQNYHRELLNDLIPAVESKYSTFAQDVSLKGIAASRDHRGFGGFSMGAVATWRTFENALDYFHYFLPMSCGTALDADNIFAAAKGHAREDYFVWVITGTQDFAQPYDQERVKLMRSSPYFAEASGEQDGNFAFRLKDGYGHDGRSATEYTYNGLQWFWGA